MEESVKSAALLFFILPISLVARAEMYRPYAGFPSSANQAAMEQASKTFGCNAVVNGALSGTGGLYAPYPGTSIPFGLDGGKIVVKEGEQNRVVSRTTDGDSETIEYKVNQIVDFQGDKPVFKMVTKKVVIKRSGGQVVSVTHPLDMAQQLSMRAQAKKLNPQLPDYKLFQSMETTIKPKENGGCETDQRLNVLVKDEKGNEKETQVTYDAEFCEGLKPAIDNIGMNNAAQCGSLISKAERILGDRNKALKGEGKTLVPGGLMNADGKKKSSMALTSMSLAISSCIYEAQASAGMGMGMGGMGIGGIGFSPYTAGGIVTTQKSESASAKKTTTQKVLEGQDNQR
jgi:hypothetical protein